MISVWTRYHRWQHFSASLCFANCRIAKMQKVSREKQVSPSGAGSHTLLRDLNIELWNKDLANNGGRGKSSMTWRPSLEDLHLVGLALECWVGNLPFPVGGFGETTYYVSASDTVFGLWYLIRYFRIWPKHVQILRPRCCVNLGKVVVALQRDRLP